jgi:predicted protein tyrosine phosphatase
VTSPNVLPPHAPGVVAVASLGQAQRHKRAYDAVLTLEDPKVRRNHRLRFSSSPYLPQLIVTCEDSDTPTRATATAVQVEAVIGWGWRHLHQSLLVHCRHGVGRSTAAALTIMVSRAPHNIPAAIARLNAMVPDSTPNLVFTQHADALLGLNGALTQTLLAHESTQPYKQQRRAIRAAFAAKNPTLYAAPLEPTL